MSEIRVSVIVPIYRTAAYIEQCIASLQKQSLAGLELILVDDASPDNAAELAEQLCRAGSLPYRLIRLKQNVGLAQARNIGISEARGEYLGFVDSDDCVAETMYARLYLAAQNEQAELAVCGMRQFDQSGVRPALSFNSPLEDTSVCNKLFSRAMVEREQLRFARGELFEDEQFTLLARHYAKQSMQLENAGYYYRINPQGICRSANSARRHHYARLSMLGSMLKEFQKRGLLAKQAELLLECLSRHGFKLALEAPSISEQLHGSQHVEYLIAKYQLRELAKPSQASYFISRFSRSQKYPVYIWLLQLIGMLKRGQHA